MAAPTIDDTRALLGSILGDGVNIQGLDTQATLLGGVPEFDSLAITALVAAFEQRHDITVEDDELDASVFTTLASLHDWRCELVS